MCRAYMIIGEKGQPVGEAGYAALITGFSKTYQQNSDGYFLRAYLPDRVLEIRTVSLPEFAGFLKSQRENLCGARKIVGHLRAATQGEREGGNVHGWDFGGYAGMHNGIMTSFDGSLTADKTKTDSYAFLEKLFTMCGRRFTSPQLVKAALELHEVGGYGVFMLSSAKDDMVFGIGAKFYARACEGLLVLASQPDFLDEKAGGTRALSMKVGHKIGVFGLEFEVMHDEVLELSAPEKLFSEEIYFPEGSMLSLGAGGSAELSQLKIKQSYVKSYGNFSATAKSSMKLEKLKDDVGGYARLGKKKKRKVAMALGAYFLGTHEPDDELISLLEYEPELKEMFSAELNTYYLRAAKDEWNGYA